MTQRTDEELIRLTLTGENRAFTEIVRRYERRVAVTIKGVIHDVTDEELADIAQDVFLLFYRSLSSFRGESQLGTYLTRITLRHCWREAKRRRKRRANVSSYDADDKTVETVRDRAVGEGRADRGVIAEERRAAVVNALRQLPEEFRTVLLMRIVEELPVEQVAEILQISTGTVKSRLHRAREKMRELLTGTGLEFDPDFAD